LFFKYKGRRRIFLTKGWGGVGGGGGLLTSLFHPFFPRKGFTFDCQKQGKKPFSRQAFENPEAV